MLRQLKKTMLNCLYCRFKRSTVIIGLLFLMFILGNYHYLHPFTTNKDFVRGTSSAITEEDALHEEYRKYVEKKRENYEDDENKKEEGIHMKLFPFKRHFEVDVDKIDIKTPPAPVHKPSAVDKPSIPIQTTTEKMATLVQLPTTVVQKPVMAVLVISCNRPDVRRSLDGIFKYKPKNIDIPVIVSQDCGHKATARVIRSYGDKVTHIKQPELGDVRNVPPQHRRFMTYHKISRHYKWALGQVFSRPHIDSVIIVEDDLDIAPDFFDYFLATRPLLDEDPTLFCISAWNDNGKPDLIDENAIDLLYRTDFFPGLGWLMTREIWREFSPKWPLGFWDDWIRQRGQRKERACLRPEISRTRTFGRTGASEGQFFDQYLQYIKLNDKPYPFLEYDLNHLLKTNYDKKFLDTVYGTPERSEDNGELESVRITYNDKYHFERISKNYGMMSDFKEGVPRTAYLGIVTIYRNNKRIYIAPKSGWKPY